MHVFEMRAEYEDGTTGGPIRQWHMTSDGATVGLCGHPVNEDSERMSADAWSHTHEKFCHTCGALYLRQVA
jgi:hypothetical protein